MLCIHASHSFSPVSPSAIKCNAPHNVYTTQHMLSFYHHDKLFAGASLRNRDSPLHHKERSEKCRQNKVTYHCLPTRLHKSCSTPPFQRDSHIPGKMGRRASFPSGFTGTVRRLCLVHPPKRPR